MSDREQQEQREGGAGVGEHECVHGRRHVVAPDPHGRTEEGDPTQARVRRAQLPDRRRLGHRHVVERSEGADHQAGQYEPATVDVRAERGSQVRGVLVGAAEPCELGERSAEHPISTRLTSVPSTAVEVRAEKPWVR